MPGDHKSSSGKNVVEYGPHSGQSRLPYDSPHCKRPPSFPTTASVIQFVSKTPVNNYPTTSGSTLTHIDCGRSPIPAIVSALAGHDRPVPGVSHDRATVDLTRRAQTIRNLLVLFVRLDCAVDGLVAILQPEPAAEPRPLVPFLVSAPGTERLEVQLVRAVYHAIVEVVIWGPTSSALFCLTVRLNFPRETLCCRDETIADSL